MKKRSKTSDFRTICFIYIFFVPKNELTGDISSLLNLTAKTIWCVTSRCVWGFWITFCLNFIGIFVLFTTDIIYFVFLSESAANERITENADTQKSQCQNKWCLNSGFEGINCIVKLSTMIRLVWVRMTVCVSEWVFMCVCTGLESLPFEQIKSEKGTITRCPIVRVYYINLQSLENCTQGMVKVADDRWRRQKAKHTKQLDADSTQLYRSHFGWWKNTQYKYDMYSGDHSLAIFNSSKEKRRAREREPSL